MRFLIALALALVPGCGSAPPAAVPVARDDPKIASFRDALYRSYDERMARKAAPSRDLLAHAAEVERYIHRQTSFVLAEIEPGSYLVAERAVRREARKRLAGTVEYNVIEYEGTLVLPFDTYAAMRSSTSTSTSSVFRATRLAAPREGRAATILVDRDAVREVGRRQFLARVDELRDLERRYGTAASRRTLNPLGDPRDRLGLARDLLRWRSLRDTLEAADPLEAFADRYGADEEMHAAAFLLFAGEAEPGTDPAAVEERALLLLVEKSPDPRGPLATILALAIARPSGTAAQAADRALKAILKAIPLEELPDVAAPVVIPPS